MENLEYKRVNPLSANPTKWLNELKQFVGFCRRIAWVGLAFKGLNFSKDSDYLHRITERKKTSIDNHLELPFAQSNPLAYTFFNKNYVIFSALWFLKNSHFELKVILSTSHKKWDIVGAMLWPTADTILRN